MRHESFREPKMQEISEEIGQPWNRFWLFQGKALASQTLRLRPDIVQNLISQDSDGLSRLNLLFPSFVILPMSAFDGSDYCALDAILHKHKYV